MGSSAVMSIVVGCATKELNNEALYDWREDNAYDGVKYFFKDGKISTENDYDYEMIIEAFTVNDELVALGCELYSTDWDDSPAEIKLHVLDERAQYLLKTVPIALQTILGVIPDVKIFSICDYF